ncbi:MAG: riboflavin synthase [bacterium]
MFTGLVECTAQIRALRPGRGIRSISLEVPLDLSESRIGDSFCIQGACLTAVELSAHALTVEVSQETLTRTTLGALRAGRRVNFERSLRLSDRLGGHLVMGHVDGTGSVIGRDNEGAGVCFRIRTEPAVSRYLVEKGSICVDGVSLTLGVCEGDVFAVHLIPHTLKGTTLELLQVRDRVNLEADLIGKYVERMLGRYGVGPGPQQGISKDLLARHGFYEPEESS